MKIDKIDAALCGFRVDELGLQLSKYHTVILCKKIVNNVPFTERSIFDEGGFLLDDDFLENNKVAQNNVTFLPYMINAIHEHRHEKGHDVVELSEYLEDIIRSMKRHIIENGIVCGS